MMKARTKISVTAALLASAFVSGSAFAVPLASGTLGPGDPTFTNPLSGACAVCFYDTVEFTVDTDGLYTFDGFYPGDTSIDENLDGYLILYANSFDPTDAGTNIIASDDDGPGGSNTSQILDVSLMAGTSYFMVVTSFSDAPTSFGQPTGPWELSGEGAGNITVGRDVPAPATLWLALLGLGVLAHRGRRRH